MRGQPALQVQLAGVACPVLGWRPASAGEPAVAVHGAGEQPVLHGCCPVVPAAVGGCLIAAVAGAAPVLLLTVPLSGP